MVTPNRQRERNNAKNAKGGTHQLNGEIPAELTNLTSLYPGTGLDLRWNAVHSQESSVIAFCNAKQYLNDWQSTQTVAPDVLLIDWVGDHTVYLRWSPVSYAELGGFEGYVAPSAGGPWASAGMTESKAIREIPITTVVPGVSYDLAVTAFTLPHALNQSTVISDPSDPEMATTSDLGCPQPVIEMAWGDPAVLSLDASYDSHAWSTGEITPTIEVSPHEKRFYWVSVTSPGSCHDSAIILVDPGEIFDDGFESGNVSAWSS